MNMKIKQEQSLTWRTLSGIGRSGTKKLQQKSGLNYKREILFVKKKKNLNLLQEAKEFIATANKTLKQRDFINFFKKLKTYKGIRHKYGYPCRGQRTHTNAKTKKKLRN